MKSPRVSGVVAESPWRLRQRPAGDWVVDQLDRATMRVRRYGPYHQEAEARAVHADLTAPWAEVAKDLGIGSNIQGHGLSPVQSENQ